MDQSMSRFLRVWKAVQRLLLVLCIGTTLCACQSAPQKPVVDSKNDGAFSQAIQTSLDKGTQRKTTENELPSLTQCTA